MKCESCGEEKRVYDIEGRPRCERCGAILIDNQWKKICINCNKETDKLVGISVPHLCVECLGKLRAKQISTGKVCRTCNKPYCDCDCCCWTTQLKKGIKNKRWQTT